MKIVMDVIFSLIKFPISFCSVHCLIFLNVTRSYLSNSCLNREEIPFVALAYDIGFIVDKDHMNDVVLCCHKAVL